MVLALLLGGFGRVLAVDESELPAALVPCASSAELSSFSFSARRLRREGGRVRLNAGFSGNVKLRPLPFELAWCWPVLGYAEKRGSSGVPAGMLRGVGRGRSLGVEAPDEEGTNEKG